MAPGDLRLHFASQSLRRVLLCGTNPSMLEEAAAAGREDRRTSDAAGTSAKRVSLSEERSMDTLGRFVADAVVGIDTLWGGDVMCPSGTGRFIAVTAGSRGRFWWERCLRRMEFEFMILGRCCWRAVRGPGARTRRGHRRSIGLAHHNHAQSEECDRGSRKSRAAIARQSDGWGRASDAEVGGGDWRR